VGKEVYVDQRRFLSKLEVRKAEIEREVQGRNAQYYNQQEDLLDRQIQDKRAEYNAQVRGYEAKEKQARTSASNADDPNDAVKRTKHARQWQQRSDGAGDECRMERRKLRDRADEYLDLIEQAVRGTKETEHLFSIRWQ